MVKDTIKYLGKTIQVDENTAGIVVKVGELNGVTYLIGTWGDFIVFPTIDGITILEKD